MSSISGTIVDDECECGVCEDCENANCKCLECIGNPKKKIKLSQNDEITQVKKMISSLDARIDTLSEVLNNQQEQIQTQENTYALIMEILLPKLNDQDAKLKTLEKKIKILENSIENQIDGVRMEMRGKI